MKYQVSFNIDFKKNPYPGKFIVLEGIDGSGKTTQTKVLGDRLKVLGRDVFLTKEPTMNVVGQLIHRILKKEIRVPKPSIQYLFGADRVIHLEEVIIPALKEGKTVVSDRYFWSSVAYGLADLDGKGDRLLVAQSILSFYHQFILPDFTFYLDVSVETAISRLWKIHKGKELYEKRNKLKKIADNYSWLVKQFSQEIIVVDGEKPVREVTEEILKHVESSK